MKKFSFTGILILAICASLPAQWTWQNPLPHGNPYNSIRFININTGFVVGDYGNCYRTTNKGANWNKINLGTLANLYTVYFRNSSTGWICGESSVLLKTTNGGFNWTQKSIGWPGTYRDIYFMNDSTGILTVNGYTPWVLRTTNYGNNWDTVHTLTSTHQLYRINFINENTGWILRTWWHVLIQPTLNTDVFYLKTSNGGINWTDNYVKTYTNSARYYQANSIIFNNINTGFVTGDFPDIIRTSNAGVNWSTQTLNIKALNFINQNFGYGAGSKIYRTSNAGNNWTGLDSALPVYHRTVSFIDSANGWFAGTGGSIYNTMDGGSSYNDQTLGTKQNINGIYFSDSLTGYACGNKGVCLKTTNAGNNWNPAGTNSFSSKNLTHINFINNSTGWICCDSAVFKTVNGGTVWSRKNLPVTGTNEKVSKTVFTLSGTGFALINSGKVFKSTDFGESWAINFTLPDAGINLFFMQQGTWFVMSKTKFYKSSNGGINWINSYTAPSNQTINSGYFINENTGWVNFSIITFPPPSMSNFIHKTTNGGLTWQSEGYHNSQLIYFHNFNEGVYINRDSLMTSSNGGNNWVKVNNGCNVLLNLTAKGKDLYLVGEYGMIMRGINIFTTSVKEINPKIPDKFLLLQNYPNPFNPVTKIVFSIPKFSNVSISVYDITGREVSVLINEKLKPGMYETAFDGSKLPSGVYFCRMAKDGKTASTKKMVLIK